MDFAEKIADSFDNINSENIREDIVYSWEQGLVKNWERLVETESGLIIVDEEGKQNKYGSKEQSINEILKDASLPNVRRGMLRNIVIILDMSSNMSELDYKPDRLQCMIKCNEIFIKQLLEDNPLTQISVVSVYDGIGELIISYNSNCDEILANISNYVKKGCKGSMSIQNGLEKAKHLLISIPPYGTKEVIFFLGSMRSIDNTFLFNEWIEHFCSNNIVINAVLLIPELYIIKTITRITGGVCLCAINNDHLLRLTLDNFIKPPPNNMKCAPLNINLVPMGFPDYLCNQNNSFLCSCHQLLVYDGYSCPKCKSIICYLPIKCPICSIYLISPNHLARSFAYLFQHPRIIRIILESEEYLRNQRQYSEKCQLCGNSSAAEKKILVENQKISIANEYMCTSCNTCFCRECCKFILSTLHQCPICCSTRIT